MPPSTICRRMSAPFHVLGAPIRRGESQETSLNRPDDAFPIFERAIITIDLCPCGNYPPPKAQTGPSSRISPSSGVAPSLVAVLRIVFSDIFLAPYLGLSISCSDRIYSEIYYGLSTEYV
jgi:hypothetical protein